MSINRILADLGKAVDSSSTGNFLNKEASGAEFNPVQWSDINSAPTILDSALASAIIDSAYVQARQTGVGSGGIDSATTIALIDSDYVGARATTGGSGFTKYQYTAIASQTTFQDSDANGNVLSYDADYILVHYNGVLLPSADYTATDGSSVVLGTGADSGSIIGIAKWGAAAGSSSGGSPFLWGGDRGIFAGGWAPSTGHTRNDTIQYFDITTPGNASDFGNLSSIRSGLGAVSDGTYGLFAGGRTGTGYVDLNNIDYITTATTSNSSDFGDLSTARNETAGAGDGTYGVFGGGGDTHTTTIDYLTVATPSNAADFGDLTVARYHIGTGGDASRGIFGGGNKSGGDGQENTIDYVTYATPSNATDFGDLINSTARGSACSDDTYTVFAQNQNTNAIEYITTQTLSNATDFGDFITSKDYQPAASNGTYGVFGGNSTNSDVTAAVNAIEYVTIATPANATDFGDSIIVLYQGVGTSGSPS